VGEDQRANGDGPTLRRGLTGSVMALQASVSSRRCEIVWSETERYLPLRLSELQLRIRGHMMSSKYTVHVWA
jgi:hypothetical protein